MAKKTSTTTRKGRATRSSGGVSTTKGNPSRSSVRATTKGGQSYNEEYDNDSYSSGSTKGGSVSSDDYGGSYSSAGSTSSNTKPSGGNAGSYSSGSSTKEGVSYNDNDNSGDSYNSGNTKESSRYSDSYNDSGSSAKEDSSYNDDGGEYSNDEYEGGVSTKGDNAYDDNYSNDDSYNSGNGKDTGGYSNNEPINDPPPYEDYNDEVVSKTPNSGGSRRSSSTSKYDNNDGEADMTFTEEEVYNHEVLAKSPASDSGSQGKERSDDEQEADMVFTEDEVYGDGGEDMEADMVFTEDEVYDNRSDETRSSGNEWNLRSAPREGQTLMGHPIRMINRNGSRRTAIIIDDHVYIITRYGERRGVFYGGKADLTRRVIASIAQNHRSENQIFFEKAVLSYTVLGEGGFSSINTYDNKIFTLGTGLAGGRLNSYLSGFSGTPLGDALNEISYFRGLRFNGSQRIRLDIETLHRIVLLFENSDNVDLVGQKSVEDYLKNSLIINNRNNRQGIREWIVEQNVCPEIIGTAAYLSHGRPRYTPNPLNDVFRAVRIGGRNLSSQIAALLKLHAQRICLDNNPDRVGGGSSGRQASAAVTRRLPNKVPHFVRAMRASGNANFQFDYSAARAILPCIKAKPWQSSSSRPSGLYLEHENRYYSLGQRIG
ncbi:hypothetical protein [Cellulophaga baltica]|uniref:hypothetical protein n=1 Tax=Cellulophaga baltica TaxID=76594 RepID=UPI0003FD2B8D|nr:hypothetical protein [Cellulophaga baltica]